MRKLVANRGKIVCPACKRARGQVGWPSCFCGACSAHNDGLYRLDHVDRKRARTMTAADIQAEYAEVGLPFAPLSVARTKEQTMALLGTVPGKPR